MLQCDIEALSCVIAGGLRAPDAAFSSAFRLRGRSMELSYFLHEASLALIAPARAASEAARLFFKNPANPGAWTPLGRSMTAACDVFERSTRRYEKPEFGLVSTVVEGETVAVTEEIVWERPFCRVIHFARQLPPAAPRQPRLLLVAPMSG